MILAMLAAVFSTQPTPPAEVLEAGEAFTQCVSSGIDEVEPGAQPRTAARAIIANCGTHQARMLSAYDRWLDGSAMSDREKRSAREETRRTISGLEAQIIGAIRANRDD